MIGQFKVQAQVSYSTWTLIIRHLEAYLVHLIWAIELWTFHQVTQYIGMQAAILKLTPITRYINGLVDRTTIT